MQYKNESLEHSFKGTTWPIHKYIRKENGRYIYPPDSEGEGKNSSPGMKKSLRSRLMNVWDEIKPSTVKQKIDNARQRKEDKKNSLPSARARKKALKAARKDIKRLSTPNYLLNKSFGARLGATLNRLARTVRNLPDVLNQRVRAANQRAEAKSKLPTEKERTAKLEAARKDLSRRTKANEQKKKVVQKNKEKEQKRKNIARKIYRETGIKVNPNDDIDLVLNGNFLKRTFKKGKSFNGAS